jgi:glutaredoxin
MIDMPGSMATECRCGGHRLWSMAGAVCAAIVVALAGPPGYAVEPRCLVVELFAGAADPVEPVAAAVETFVRDREGVRFVRRFPDIEDDDRRALAALAEKYRFPADSTPVITVCGRVMHGFRDAAAVPGRLEDALRVELFSRPGCGKCTLAKAWLPTLADRYPALRTATFDLATDAAARDRLAELVQRHRTAGTSVPVIHVANRLVVGFDRAEISGPRIEGLLLPWSRPCREPVGSAAEPPEALGPVDALGPAGDDETAIEVSLFGRIDSQRLGMPLFTIVIGLIDGFNPCAMWILLLLLSILVNVRDRTRIILIAGTFVLVSGVAYFAFMAAWLHVFEWIGYLRPVQITLGLLAVAIGLVHVKDFFAFQKGITLSIPQAAKPGIYRRIQRIVTAENLPAALLGTFTLAVLVNLVELLCTAGLPALYTNILSRQGYSLAGQYAYLGLYILAYMFDDALMVAAVVWSFSKFRLQETGGRWLKLLSGLAILVLGLVMLLRPEWLE